MNEKAYNYRGMSFTCHQTNVWRCGPGKANETLDCVKMKMHRDM